MRLSELTICAFCSRLRVELTVRFAFCTFSLPWLKHHLHTVSCCGLNRSQLRQTFRIAEKNFIVLLSL